MKKRALSFCTALFLAFSLLSCGPAGSDPSDGGVLSDPVSSPDSIRLLNGKPEIDDELQNLPLNSLM